MSSGTKRDSFMVAVTKKYILTAMLLLLIFVCIGRIYLIEEWFNGEINGNKMYKIRANSQQMINRDQKNGMSSITVTSDGKDQGGDVKSQKIINEDSIHSTPPPNGKPDFEEERSREIDKADEHLNIFKSVAFVHKLKNYLINGKQEKMTTLGSNEVIPSTNRRINFEDIVLKNKHVEDVWDSHDFECIGWKQTSDCDPFGSREVHSDKACHTMVSAGMSGYCEIRNSSSGEIFQVMRSTCRSIQPEVKFNCNMAMHFTNYKFLSERYIQHPTAPTFQKSFHQDLTNGIVYAIYPKGLITLFASIRLLRSLGCTLPIELWYRQDELTPEKDPIVQELVKFYGAQLRLIEDPSVQSFCVKPYAVYYSSFDRVLLLDGDNFVARDPTYLFYTDEFKSTGAIFWPDYWHPGNTLFNIHDESLVWELLGIKYIHMYEQESGQVLIDRTRHKKALDVLMFYNQHQPRLLTNLKLVYGDKDLFRMAWLKTNSTFHMIQKLPGSLGYFFDESKHDDNRKNGIIDTLVNTLSTAFIDEKVTVKPTIKTIFCGVTLAQFDPSGQLIFVHRNQVKLLKDQATLTERWTHLEEYTGDLYSMVITSFSQKRNSCFGSSYGSKNFTSRAVSAVPGLAQLEPAIVKYALEATKLTTELVQAEV